jgi:HSP20 family protein
MNWDPLRGMVTLRGRPGRHPPLGEAAWIPSVDLLEAESSFLIIVELAGLGASDFSLTTSGNGLTLSGERPAPAGPAEGFIRLERGHGRFSRTFSFAEPVDVDAMQATFERGLLRITVPKARGADRRRIVIS